MLRMIEWFIVNEGHVKHGGKLHPAVSLTLAFGWIWFCSAVAHDFALGSPLPRPLSTVSTERPKFFSLENSNDKDFIYACSLCLYWAFLCGLRLASLGLAQVTYEAFWSCNMALLLAAGGLATSRPHLASAAAISVSVDQVLWVVDVVGYLLTRTLFGRGQWAVGVAKYLTWPTTTWARRATSTHHLWFLPFVAYAVGVPCRRIHAHDVINAPDVATLNSTSSSLERDSWWQAFALDYALSLVIITAIASVTRCFVPFYMSPSTQPTDQTITSGATRNASTHRGSNASSNKIETRSNSEHENNNTRRSSSSRSRSNSRGHIRSRSKSLQKGADMGGDDTSSDMSLSNAPSQPVPQGASSSARSSRKAETANRGAYLNVNLVYEVWRDLQSLPWIQCSHPSPWVHVPRLLCFWAVLNLPCSLVFAAVSTACVAFRG